MFIVKRCPFLCGLTHPSILDLAKDGASMTEHRLGSLCFVCGGAHAPPRAVVGAPPTTFFDSTKTFRRGVETGTRGACAPQKRRVVGRQRTAATL